jgi:(2R)-3-sulfolactate dehydrogenase (NADP+)
MTADPDVVSVNRHEVVALCLAALDAVGADRRVAELLTEAALFAEDRGRAVVGVAHMLDHVDAMEDGRLDGRAVPLLGHPAPTVTTSDARGGIAQTGFDGAFAGLVKAAHHYGLAVFAQQGSFTCGPLGWFTERLADAGLVAVATAVSPAVLAAGAVTDPATTCPPRTPRVAGRPAPDQFTRRVFGTNPMAWSVPLPDRAPLTVDQASSSTAFVSVRDVAAQGTRLPEGWAVDADGRPTTDPEAALDGALLPFGGYKGANIALLVELLSSMAGGNWSMDAPPWDSGARSPSVGMFVLAVDHSAVGLGFPARAAEHLGRLADSGVQLPGDRRTGPSAAAADHLVLRADVVAALRRRAGGGQ